MARTKQTASRSTGGKAPRKKLSILAARNPRSCKAVRVEVIAMRPERQKGDKFICETEDGETIHIRAEELDKTWLGFTIAADERVDCAVLKRLEGFTPLQRNIMRASSPRENVQNMDRNKNGQCGVDVRDESNSDEIDEGANDDSDCEHANDDSSGESENDDCDGENENNDHEYEDENNYLHQEDTSDSEIYGGFHRECSESDADALPDAKDDQDGQYFVSQVRRTRDNLSYLGRNKTGARSTAWFHVNLLTRAPEGSKKAFSDAVTWSKIEIAADALLAKEPPPQSGQSKMGTPEYQKILDAWTAHDDSLHYRAKCLLALDTGFNSSVLKDRDHIETEALGSRALGESAYASPLVPVDFRSKTKCATSAFASLVMDQGQCVASALQQAAEFENFSPSTLGELDQWLRCSSIYRRIARSERQKTAVFTLLCVSFAKVRKEVTPKIRLEWLLNQENGEFLVVLASSDGHDRHTVGVSVSRKLLFDPSEKYAMEFSRAGFDACCAAGSACNGLVEIRRVNVLPLTTNRARGKRRRLEMYEAGIF